MFQDRFRGIHSKVEIELAHSYPVCGENKETVFFYSTEPNDETSFRIGEIRYVFSRDIASGDISEIPFEKELFNLTEKCKGEVIAPKITGMEALDLEYSYYDLYEEYYESCEKGDPDMVKRADMSDILDQLVPESGLKDLYRYFGGDLREA